MAPCCLYILNTVVCIPPCNPASLLRLQNISVASGFSFVSSPPQRCSQRRPLQSTDVIMSMSTWKHPLLQPVLSHPSPGPLFQPWGATCCFQNMLLFSCLLTISLDWDAFSILLPDEFLLISRPKWDFNYYVMFFQIPSNFSDSFPLLCSLILQQMFLFPHCEHFCCSGSCNFVMYLPVPTRGCEHDCVLSYLSSSSNLGSGPLEASGNIATTLRRVSLLVHISSQPTGKKV